MTEADRPDPARRPARPQYGEYATPEEVAAITGKPVQKVAPPVPSGSVEPILPSAVPLAELPPPSWPKEESAPIAPRPGRAADVAVTAVLLGVGVAYFLLLIPGYLTWRETLQQALELAGYTGMTVGSGAEIGGIVLLAAHAGLLALAIGLSVRLIRRGRRAFWVPLLGATATLVLTFVILLIVMLGDPQFMSELTRR